MNLTLRSLIAARKLDFHFSLNLAYNRAMETRLEKTVTKVNIHQQTNDFAYWQTQSYKYSQT